MLDIICMIFIIVMAIYGYVRGFIVRLYDLLGTIVVLFFSYYLCGTLSSIYTIYHYDTTDVISVMLGQMVNQLLIFIILFIILSIIKKLLGLILKPLLVRITHFFSLTAFIDRILGALMSMAEGIILIYLVLLFVLIPFNNSLIDDSKVAEYLLNVMPEVSESLMNMSECMNSEEVSDQMVLNMMMSAYNNHLISDDVFINVLNDEIADSDENLKLSYEQYEKLSDILSDLEYSQSDIENVLKNIDIGEVE